MEPFQIAADHEKRLRALERLVATLTQGTDVPVFTGSTDDLIGTLSAAQMPALTGDVTSSAGSVATTIANDAVSNAKAANMAQATIKGRAAGAGTGDPTDLTPNQASTVLDGATDPFVRASAATTGITQLTGDVTAGPGSFSQAATIANDAVTNAKAANMAQARIKGRAAVAGTGDPTDLTPDETSTILDGATDPLTRKSYVDGLIGAGAATRIIGITVDGGGSVLTTGVKGFIQVPFAGTITKASVFSTDPSSTAGSIVFDVWKDTYANYPPTVADTITASAKPTLSSASKSTDSTLTGWTTSISVGDVIGFTIDSVSTLTRVTLELEVST